MSQEPAHDRRDSDRWRLSHEVPLGVVFIVLGQIIAGFWWGASIDGRVTTVERAQEKLTVAVTQVVESSNKIVTQVAVLQNQQDERTAQVREIREILHRIEVQVRDEIDRRNGGNLR